VRLRVPVGADAHLGQQRHLQNHRATPAISAGTSLARPVEFGVGHLEHQFVVHLHHHARGALPAASSAPCTAIIASLIRSAAVPCIGALMAWRSAPRGAGRCRPDLGQPHAAAEEVST
jgi:hypothetical protein